MNKGVNVRNEGGNVGMGVVMLGMRRMPGIRVGMRGIRVGIRQIRVAVRRIRAGIRGNRVGMRVY